MKKISGYVIKLKEVLGKGSYGSVYLGEHEQTHRECAIKVIDKKQSTNSTNQSSPTNISNPPSCNRSKFFSKCVRAT